MKKNSETHVSFGATLEGLMARYVVSDVVLARAVGVSHTAIANYRKGRIPKAVVLHKIADYFGANAGELLKGEREGKIPAVFPAVEHSKKKLGGIPGLDLDRGIDFRPLSEQDLLDSFEKMVAQRDNCEEPAKGILIIAIAYARSEILGRLYQRYNKP